MAASELQSIGEQVRGLVDECRSFVERNDESRDRANVALARTDTALQILNTNWSEWIDDCIETWGHWEYDPKLDSAPDLISSGGQNIDHTSELSQDTIRAAEDWLALHLGD
jgi:hypothetical protein